MVMVVVIVVPQGMTRQDILELFLSESIRDRFTFLRHI